MHPIEDEIPQQEEIAIEWPKRMGINSGLTTIIYNARPWELDKVLTNLPRLSVVFAP